MAGKVLGRLAGARKLEIDVVKEWFLYFTSVGMRRCSLFCPLRLRHRGYHHDGRSFCTWLAATSTGSWSRWPLQPHRQPPGHPAPCLQGMVDFLCEDIETVTGGCASIPTLNRKGAENPLQSPPRANIFARPGHLHLHGLPDPVPLPGSGLHLEHLRVGGRQIRAFHLRQDHEKLNAKNVPPEAKRWGVKVDTRRRVGRPHVAGHQPVHADHERPGRLHGDPGYRPSPAPVRRPRPAPKMLHISEFTGRPDSRTTMLKLVPAATPNLQGHLPRFVQPRTGAWGFWKEPRYIIRTCPEFYEMPENTIREQTFCCGGGAGLNNEEFLETRSARRPAGATRSSTCRTPTG